MPNVQITLRDVANNLPNNFTIEILCRNKEH